MTKRREILTSLTAIPLATGIGWGGAPGEAAKDRDKELFLEAAVELANGKYVRARLLLHTLISVYETSPFVAQARMLVFYSHAVEYPRIYGAERLLNEIDEYLKVVDEVKQG